MNGGTIGRAHNNNWSLPDPACYLSSQHALISYQGGKFYITDLSSNGTFINGRDIALGKSNTACFDEINSLTMGPYTVSVQIQSNAPADTNKQGSLTSMFAQPTSEPAPSPIPAQASPFENIDEGVPESSDPLALLGGAPDSAPQFPEDWAKDESSIANRSINPQDMIPNNQVNDAFTPPQAITPPNTSSEPALPPEDWDKTFFTPASSHAVPDTPQANMPSASNAAPAGVGGQTYVDTTPDPFAPETPPSGANIIPEDPSFFGAPARIPSSETSKPAQSPDSVQANAQPAMTAPPAAAPSGQNFREDDTLVGFNTHEPSSSPVAEIPDPFQAQQTATPAAQPEEPLSAILKPMPGGAQPPAETAPQTPPAAEKESMAIAEATFRANGLDPTLLQDPKFVDQAVALLPYFLEGTLNILQSRAQVKNELRASKTIFQAIDNNPLKYSVNLQDAIQNLFTHRRPGFLSPNDAIKEAFVDIEQHETALVSGIQGGLNGLLDKIKPETIESRIQANESKKNLFGKISSSKKWDFYKETYSHITDTSGDSFLELFGSDFLNAYESHINQKTKNGK